MLEALFLLLPVAVAYGWYMGRRSIAHQQQDQKQALSQQYVAGLNYLLSDDADKAVDLFIEMMEVDTDTIDTHMALASLFRRRGEVERAIKLHQNILERAHLSKEQHQLTMLELARDFSATGLLDRAEAIYKKITGSRQVGEQATRELVCIYQSLREWPKAIHFAEKLKADKTNAKNIAQYYCQHAEELLTIDSEGSFQYLRKALKADPLCVRASIMLGYWHKRGEQYPKAVEHFQRVLEQDIDFVSEVILPLEECYRQLGNMSAFDHFLLKANERGAGATSVIALADHLKQQHMAEDAEVLELTQLRRHPSLKGFLHYMQYHVDRAESVGAKESLETLRTLVKQQLEAKPKYRCRSCGFSGNVLQWQCPSCKSWGQTKPVRGLDGE